MWLGHSSASCKFSRHAERRAANLHGHRKIAAAFDGSARAKQTVLGTGHGETLAAAAFPGGPRPTLEKRLSCKAEISTIKSRLKGGCSQDWLPHSSKSRQVKSTPSAMEPREYFCRYGHGNEGPRAGGSESWGGASVQRGRYAGEKNPVAMVSEFDELSGSGVLGEVTCSSTVSQLRLSNSWRTSQPGLRRRSRNIGTSGPYIAPAS